jgi:hypothetical protein
MPAGLPKGFVRLTSTRKGRLDLFAGCQHPNFTEDGRCSSCSYNLWTPIRRQIRELEETGKSALEEEDRVASVIAIITASRSWSDGLRYVGVLPRLPRRLRPAGSGPEKKTKAAIDAAQAAGAMKQTTLALIDQNGGQLEAAGFSEDDLLNLSFEVDAFLDAYLVRFHFTLQEKDLWPMILAYAAHVGEIPPDKIEENYFLDTDQKRERFKWWHRLLRISKETLGEDSRTRYER